MIEISERDILTQKQKKTYFCSRFETFKSSCKSDFGGKSVF